MFLIVDSACPKAFISLLQIITGKVYAKAHRAGATSYQVETSLEPIGLSLNVDYSLSISEYGEEKLRAG